MPFPNFNINAATLLNAFKGGSLMSIVGSTLMPAYNIYDQDDNKVFKFAGVIKFDVDAGAITTTVNIEKGSYSTINKVKLPSRISVSAVISGLTGFSGAIPNFLELSLTSPKDILEELEEARKSAKVYKIETPNKMFESVDLVNYSYSVSSKTGVQLLTVNMEFDEIIQENTVVVGSEVTEKSNVNNATSEAGGSTENTQSSTKPSVIDDLKSAANNLKDSFNSAVDSVTKGFNSALDSVGKAANDLLKPASQALNDATKDLKSKLL